MTEPATESETEPATGPMPPQQSPSKHRSIHTLQDIVTADETTTGLPPRVPQSRLPGGRRQRGVLAAIENMGSDGDGDGRPVRRQRRKSDFDVWKDEAVRKKAESSFETAAAAVDTSPASLKGTPPKGHRSRGGDERAGDIEALVEEYLGGGRRKVASPVSAGTDEITAASTSPPPAHVPAPHTRKHSASTLRARSHPRPRPELAPFPAPPLSLLHRKFASPSSPPLAAPAAALPSLPPATDPSPLQQMRAFRAHFESLLPSPRPQPRRQPPPASPPQPRHRTPPHSPRRPPSKPSPSPSPPSLAAKYAFTLPHLPPLTHHSRTAIVTLTPTARRSPGSITLQLRNLAELKGGGTHTYHIPTHGLPITITEHSTNTETTYAIEDLPLKHLTAVRYARRFVDVAKRSTIVGRVEVREKYRGGGIWVGRRWGDGRFEALSEDLGLRIEIFRGRVRLLRGDREIPIDESDGGGRHSRILDRAKRMHAACEKALDDEEEDEEEGDTEPDDTDDAPSRSKRTETVPVPVPSSSTSSASRRVSELDKPFRVDSTTTFVPAVGWCRRSDDGWWSMLFLDGVRLEIDPVTGDAVWVEKAGTRRVLKKGMEMRRVRERVRRFVEKGL